LSAGLVAGTHTLLVGVEDQDDGGLRMYLGHRASGVYAVVYDDDAKATVRRAWASRSHVTVPIPPSGCVYLDLRDRGDRA
jgi:hypothetical protein